MNFEDLPTEIVHMIFTYLTDVELYKAAKTSKRIRSIALDPNLWKKIYLCSFYDGSDAMYKILKRCTRAQQIKLDFVRDFSWVSLVPTCETVEKIKINSCYPKLVEDVAARLVKLYPRVSNLKVTEDTINADIIRSFVQWQFLHSIHLQRGWSEFEDYNNTFNGDEILILIAENCKNLEKLYMKWFGITDKAFLRFIELRGPELKSLTINCNNLTSVSYQSLKCCQSMEFLDLGWNVAMTCADKAVLDKLKADVWLQYWTPIDCEDSSD